MISRRVLSLPERGVDFALVDWGGSGPFALLSHANGFCADLFGPIATRLCERYRVIGFDSRGHGDSSTPAGEGAFEWEEFALDVAAVAHALVAELGVPRVELGVGHSFAGTCMLTAAARHPDLFGRVAALDPIIHPRRSERSEPLARRGIHAMAERARRRRVVFDSREAVRKRWAERGTFGEWDLRVMDLYLERGFRDRPDRGVELKCLGETEAAIYAAGSNFDALAEVRELVTPAIVYFAAEGDRPRALVEQLAASLDCIELEGVAAGHLLPMLVPDLIAEKLLTL